MVTIDSPKEIFALEIDSNYFSNVSASNDTLSSLYRYFGYESAELETPSESTSYDTAEFVEIAEPKATLETYFTVNITDAKMLEELFPILYFGNYRDTFELNEYIHLGYVQTTNGNSVGCYVKPGTLPEEIIELIFESQKTYEY